MLSRLIALNRAASRKLDVRWPYTDESFGATYTRRVLEAVRPGARITDVGAGRVTRFAPQLPAGCELIGVDVRPEDLKENAALAVRVTRDVIADGFPVESARSDVVCSQFVLEHMPDLRAFGAGTFSALKPGGVTVHLFAGRRSLFASLNRLLPERVARRLLFWLRPQSVEVAGFKAYYDRTDPRAARAVFERAGFVEVTVDLSWENSQYFQWFLPAFVLVRAWESAIERLGLDDVASYVILTARKPQQ